MISAEKVELFFQQLRGKSNPAVQDIRNAAAATGDVSEIVPVILSCASGMGIDASAELAGLTGAQDTAWQEAAFQETATALAKKSGDFAGESDPEKRRELLDTIRKAAASLDAPGKKDRFGTWDEFISECTGYDPGRDFKPSLFNGLGFPPGSVSYIGGRAKAGKTTVLINLLREALFNNRQVLFITLEMSRRQLLIKLILCIAFAITGDKPERGELRSRGSFERWERTGQTPQKDLYTLLHGKPLPESGYGREKTFIDTVNRARGMVQKFFVEKKLLIYDGRGAGFPEIINIIGSHGSGALVLLDYIQRMPPADESGRDDYTRIKKISDGVLLAAVRTNTVIISGAQFNRTVTRNDKGDEIVETTSFRESGDLEQDGFNLLGIARLAGKGKRYIKMFAGREEMIEDDAYSLDYEGAYSYMAVKEKIKAPEETRHCPRRKKQEEPAPEDKPEEKKWGELFSDKRDGNREKS
jgi:hypothetical protein